MSQKERCLKQCLRWSKPLPEEHGQSQRLNLKRPEQASAGTGNRPTLKTHYRNLCSDLARQLKSNVQANMDDLSNGNAICLPRLFTLCINRIVALTVLAWAIFNVEAT